MKYFPRALQFLTNIEIVEKEEKYYGFNLA
jgi:hypothetical protein